MTEYPKALYLHGFEDLAAYVTVNNAAEEHAARGKGYKFLADQDSQPDAMAEKPKRGRKPKVQDA